MRKFFAALLLLPALACAQILGGTTPSTGFGATPGISGQTTQPSFAAALTTTIVPAISLGSPTATFTRATTATVNDQDGIVRSALSGEVRFQGARRVQNLISGGNTSFDSWAASLPTGWTAGAAVTVSQVTGWDGTGSAVRYSATTVGNVGTNRLSSNVNLTSINTATYRVTARARLISGSQGNLSVAWDGVGTFVLVPAASSTSWQRYSVNVAGGVGALGQFALFVNNSSDSTWDIDDIQLENITGQANTNPAEYVSVGTLAAPFQGANVDGVQYFSTQNTNVVQQNITTRSQQFTAGAWSPANVTVAEDVTTAPDGTLTADSLTATLTNACRNSEGSGVTVGQMYTASAYFKSTSNVMGFISIDNGGGSVSAYVKGTLTGAGTTSTGGTGVVLASSITSVGSSWYRMTLTFVADANSTRFSLGVWNPASADASGYPGAVLGDKIFAWGSQINPGAFAASYVPTTTVAINNGIVETGLAPQIASATLAGYVSEGARTNLILQSNAYTTTWAPGGGGTASPVQDTVGPDGLLSAWTLTDSDAAAFRSQAQNITVPNDNQTYVVSIYVKKTSGGTSPVFAVNTALSGGVAVNTNARWDTDTGLSGSVTATVPLSQSVGNYWRVFVVTTNNTSGNTTLNIAVFPASGVHTASPTSASDAAATTGTAVIYGSQVEAATYAASYIPTTTVAVTRNADTLTYAGAGNMSNTVGTAYAELTNLDTGSTQQKVAIGTDSGASSGPLQVVFGSAVTTICSFDSVNQISKGGLSNLNSVVGKRASSWGTGISSTGDGLTVASGAFDGSMGNGTTIGIGCSGAGTSQWFGTIRNAIIFPAQFTDAQLQGKTGP